MLYTKPLFDKSEYTDTGKAVPPFKCDSSFNLISYITFTFLVLWNEKYFQVISFLKLRKSNNFWKLKIYISPEPAIYFELANISFVYSTALNLDFFVRWSLLLWTSSSHTQLCQEEEKIRWFQNKQSRAYASNDGHDERRPRKGPTTYARSTATSSFLVAFQALHRQFRPI